MNSPAASGTLAPTIRATGFMLLAAALLAAMHGCVRLATFETHPFEVAFFRNVFGFLVMMPMLLHGGISMFKTKRPGLHLVRGVLNGGSMLMWFMALSLIPLADATALTLTGPMFVALAAILFLGERVGIWRWAAMAVGIAGALCVIRPGYQEVSLGAMLAVGCVALAALSKISAKSLTRDDDPATVAASVQFLMIPVTFVPALFYWQWPTLDQLLLMAGIGVLGGLGHYSFTRAYAIADISFAEPIVFTRMIWATAFGFLVFAEIPDLWTWIGAILIVSGTTLLAWRERRAKIAATG